MLCVMKGSIFTRIAMGGKADGVVRGRQEVQVAQILEYPFSVVSTPIGITRLNPFNYY